MDTTGGHHVKWGKPGFKLIFKLFLKDKKA
jgi:hypothetical protein